jgi:23S rRNA pseudouridine1911/1915/1917 synthase
MEEYESHPENRYTSDVSEQEIREQEEQTDEMYEHFRVTVDRGQSPLRMDKFLSSRMKYVSRSRIKQASQAGNILVNGVCQIQNYKVKPLDEIAVLLANPPKELDIIPEDIALDIIYEDEDVILVNKQAGMVVHPAQGNYTGTLVNALCYHLRDMLVHGSLVEAPKLVHRIDKDTSGILIVAKTDEAQAKLASAFFTHSIHRRYQALVWGDLEAESGCIEGNIGRSLKDRRVMSVFPNGEYGRHAVTHWRTLERLGYVTLVECRLETGRTHQIRVHFQHIGHPLFNDSVYGGNRILKGTLFSKYKQFVQNCFSMLPRQALHAWSLGFRHPRTGEEMLFSTPLPSDMQTTLDKWRHYAKHKAFEAEP